MPAEQNPPARSDIPPEFRDDFSYSPARPGELPPPVSAGRGPGAVKRGGVSDFWALVGCNAIVFGTSVCIMVLELTASRLIAPYVGSSLYTWTSVIGVVLAGISIGNYFGGWLADRFPPQKVLAWLFLISGLLTFSVLILNGWAAETHRPEKTSWPVWVMLVVAWVFFLPALSLGTISPVTASMALKRSVKTGITVGNIYAWGALGSIVGTFLTGFWLIGEFGSRQVICVTSCALVIMGVLVAAGQRAFRTAALVGAIPLIVQFGIIASTTEKGMEHVAQWIAGIRSGWSTTPDHVEADQDALKVAVEKNDLAAIEAAQTRAEWRSERETAEKEWAKWGARLGRQLHSVGLTLALRSDKANEYNDESDYFSINISNGHEEGDSVKQLRLDYLTHSYYNPDNPTKLYYTYEKVYAAITERAAQLWSRQTTATVRSFPDGGDVAPVFPGKVTYDRQSKQLTVRGAMRLDDLRELLSTGPYADYWQTVISAWEEASTDWGKASQTDRGMLLTRLDELPDGITFPHDLGVVVHYDRFLKSLVTTRPFDLDEMWQLLSLGQHGEYVAAVRELFEKSRRTSTLFIGGGGFVFPRWIEATFPHEPRIDVAEIDPAVLHAIQSELGLPKEYGPPSAGKTYVRTHIGDARKFVDDQWASNKKTVAEGGAPVTYDFVYGDAFNDLSVPWHLTTKEFSTKVRDLLTPGQGVFLVNIIDIYPRTEYPDESDKVGQADVPYFGKLPSMLAPVQKLTGEFVPCRGGFAGLEVSQQNGSLVLRYSGAMSKEVRNALDKLDPLGTAAAMPDRGFSGAVAKLYQKSNKRLTMQGSPPDALAPANWSRKSWQKATSPYDGLQFLREDDGGYYVGYRGVMTGELRDKFLAEAGADDKFKTAIASLYRRSRAEEVGQFLGRYVATAREIFPYVYVFTSDRGEPGESRDTFIIACSLQQMSFDDLESSGGHWSTGPFAWTETSSEGQAEDRGEMRSVLELSRGLMLTDNFAPVDNLLAPVFVNRSGD
ncbi:MAG TPA: fused MFS/spermidine synthase [Planctomycetaceae bacterium]